MKKLDNTLILMGIKHCGKSTQGRLLAGHFGCDFFDTDDIVEKITGKSPREIYSTQGKDAFMEAEVQACKTFLNKTGKFIISTGGGICNNQKAIDELRKLGKFIFLNSEETTACDRIIKEIKINENGKMENLPAYIAKENPKNIENVRSSFHNFYVERQKVYKSLCDIEIKMLPISKNENLERILQSL